MRSLVQESVYTINARANAAQAVSLTSKDIRPRLEGYEGALRGPALSAQLADRGSVVFEIRPQAASAAAALAALGTLQVFLTVEQYPLLGSDVGDNGTTQFPFIETDVSGTLVLFRGRLVYDLQAVGVCKLKLRILNWDTVDHLLLINSQIYADVRVPQWEREREGEEEA